MNAFIQQVFTLTNLERAQFGLAPLTLDIQLSQAAQNHSNDMAYNDFFGHAGSNGSTATDRIHATGYEYQTAAENVAAGFSTAAAVVNGWMNSSGHRANILNPEVKNIGIGYIYLADDTGNLDYRHYWTQVFGTRSVNSEAARLVVGTAGDDWLWGSSSADQMAGGAGQDQLIGEAGRDLLQGQGGNDVLRGGTDEDQLWGNAGNDVLFGNAGNDTLEGGVGHDHLLGNLGDDVLVGISRKAGNRGQGEVDRLEGLLGADALILGDETGVFYDDGNAATQGRQDYAHIIGLDATDKIQLAGSIVEYQLVESVAIDGVIGTGIFHQGELIGLVQDTSVAATQATLFFV